MVSLTVTSPRPPRQKFTRLSVTVWILAALAFGLASKHVHGSLEVFAKLDVDPPGIVALGFKAGAFMKTNLGLVLAIATLASTLLPFVLGVRARLLGLFYLSLAILAFAAAAGMLYFHESALPTIHEQLNAAAGR